MHALCRVVVFNMSNLYRTKSIRGQKTLKQLAEQLGASQKAVFNRLREMRKIQKTGRWVPLELNDRQMEKGKNTRDILLVHYKWKPSLHRIGTGNEKWNYFENG